MFGMVPLIKSLALAQYRLMRIIVAHQRRQLENDPGFSTYASSTEELEKEISDLLRKLGVK